MKNDTYKRNKGNSHEDKNARKLTSQPPAWGTGHDKRNPGRIVSKLRNRKRFRDR